EIISDDVAFTNLSLNASSFAWTFGDGSVSSEANPTHNYQDGFFNGNLIATNGCDADTFYFDVLIFTGVKDITDDPTISVLPNPTSGRFKLSWTDNVNDAVGVKIYSLEGKQIYGQDAVVNDTEIDLSGIPAGMYVMHILKDGVRSMKRVVLQE
ncbi:MAG TPA: T9SS type A sorting domain-containing protein, partial [Saprospiraceae bacterium]|nr:T9SS type A sorting domain-containing protein [Saprospiraceae bacterium]